MKFFCLSMFFGLAYVSATLAIFCLSVSRGYGPTAYGRKLSFADTVEWAAFFLVHMAWPVASALAAAFLVVAVPIVAVGRLAHWIAAKVRKEGP